MSLITALRSEDVRLVETVCVSGASPNDLENGASAMHIATGMQSKYDLQLTRILLQYGGDPNVMSDELVTPIHISVIWGKHRVLKLLLKRGGDPTIKDEENYDAWDYALKYGRSKCQQVLQEYLDAGISSGSEASSDDQSTYVSIFSSDTQQRSCDKLYRSEDIPTRDPPRHKHCQTEVTNDNSSRGDRRKVSIMDEVDCWFPAQSDSHDAPRPPPRRSRSIRYDKVCDRLRQVSESGKLRVQPKEGSESSATDRVIDRECRAERLGRSYSTPDPHLPSLLATQTSSSKTKKRSPLAKLTKSPSRTLMKWLSKISPNSHKQTNKTNTFDECDGCRHQQRQTSQRQHVSAKRQLIGERAAKNSDLAANSDNCIIILNQSSGRSSGRSLGRSLGRSPRHKSPKQTLCSPSNYVTTSVKPEQEKKIMTSPLGRRLSQKSGRSLFRLSKSKSTSPPPVDKSALLIRPNQTLRLRDQDADDISQLSLADVSAVQQVGARLSQPSSSANISSIESGIRALDVTDCLPDGCSDIDTVNLSQASTHVCDDLVLSVTGGNKCLSELASASTAQSSPKSVTFDLSSQSSHQEQITPINHQAEPAPHKPPRTYKYSDTQPASVTAAAPTSTPPPPAPFEDKSPLPAQPTTSSSLNHRWPARRQSSQSTAESTRTPVTQVESDNVESADMQASKDSGVGSSSEVYPKVSTAEGSIAGSEDTFHTCNMDEDSNDTTIQLPTEMDSLLAKVCRMKLHEYDNDATFDIDLDKVDSASMCHDISSEVVYSHLNVTLTELRLPILDCSGSDTSAATNKSLNWKTFRRLSAINSPDARSEDVPTDITQLSDSQLLRELVALGHVPGPITDSTRRLYQTKLTRLREMPATDCAINSGYSKELRQFVTSYGSNDTSEISRLEFDMFKVFENSVDRKWREGNSKTSFNYLLLDPRTTKNLPARHHLLDADGDCESFKVFLSSIFYIGKGKKSRPYQHFIDCLKNKKKSAKNEQIKAIWQQGHGVIALHVFHNTIAVEGYTREACMVDTIGLCNLTNVAKCCYYGVASTWDSRRRQLVGASLLHKAYSILLIEGERQIRPTDVGGDVSQLPDFLK